MTAQRVEQLRQRISAALQPELLDIEDESHLHEGHAGAREGLGHFHVRVVSRKFDGKRPLQRHRLIYEAAGDMMQTDIHALRIEALTPDEN